MKYLSAFLLLAILSLTCLGYAMPSIARLQETYIESGHVLPENDVDYWWIPNVNKGEVVLCSIVGNDSVWYHSWLYYSNLTELQYRSGGPTHNHDFVADKTDNYLLKIEASWEDIRCCIKHSKVDTVLDFSFIPNPAKPGDTVTLLGTLETVGGSPVYPASVTVEYSTSGGVTWGYLWTLDTDAAGEFSKTFTAPGVGEYLVRVSYVGSATYNSSSETETLVVVSGGLTESWIYFVFRPNPVSPGQSVTLKGILVDDSTDPIASADVTVKYSTNNGATWTPIWTLTTNQYGIFLQTFTAPGTGVYLVQVSYAGSSTYKPTASNAYLVVL